MDWYEFFVYLRLKILVTLLRVMVCLIGSPALRRDRLLAEMVGVERKKIKIPSRDTNRYIEADIYSPCGHSAAKAPVLVNWHRSGFIFPLLGSDALYCSQIARNTGITVIDADYRKGPETIFPGPLDDAVDILKWVATQDQFDSTRIGVSGFSARGTIALAAASSLGKEFVEAKIPVAVALYPVTDLSIAPEAKIVDEPKKAHPPFMQHLFSDCYVPDKAMRNDPRVSPSAADPVESPPTVVILTCDGDIFAPEASALADELDDGRRRVINRTLKNVHHGFDKSCKSGTNEWVRREEAYALVETILKETIRS